MKKIILFCLCLIFTLGSVACKKQPAPSSSGEHTPPEVTDDISQVADVWAAVSSIKVLGDESADDYLEYRLDKIRLDAVKNEYENGLIVVSAKTDLEYSVELSDLVKKDDTTKKIAKDNFNVYMEIFTNVTVNTHGLPLPLGQYPDAILPQENAIKYSKNLVNKGNNGCAWLEYYIPKNTEAGLYEGNAIVTVNNKKTTVPVELKVYDIDLSDETTSKSLFVINTDSIFEHELDCTQEMYDKYLDMFIRNRLTPATYMTSLDQDYFEKAIEYYHKGTSTISLRVRGATEKGYSVFNKQVLYEDIIKFAELSLRDNENYVEKLVFYNSPIDEPWAINYPAGTVDYSVTIFEDTIKKVKNNLSADERFNSEFGEEIIAGVDKIPNVITDFLDTQLVDVNGFKFSYYNRDVVLCPEFHCYDSEEAMNDYYECAQSSNNEQWWYGCVGPRHPYPGYHLEDTLVSPMLISWMMAEYNIAGNLYWSVNYHIDLSGSIIEDPYSDPLRGKNGEGLLVYPGKIFGVNGPVSSIRMEAIRDGNEDYEILQQLKTIYKEHGEDATSLINAISQNLYDMTKIRGDEIAFEYARTRVLEAIESAKEGFFVTAFDKAENDTDGVAFEITVKAVDGMDVYYNNEKLDLTNNSASIFMFLAGEENLVNFKAVKNGKECVLTIDLGGKQTSLFNNEFTDETFSGDITEKKLLGLRYQLTLSKNENATVTFENAILSSVTKNTKALQFYVENPANSNVTCEVLGVFGNVGQKSLQTLVLTPGKNLIEFYPYDFDGLNNYGNLEKVIFNFTGAETINFGNVFALNK